MSDAGMRGADPRYADAITPDVVEKVRGKAVDGRITCPMLRKLADDLGVPYQVVGQAANEAGIKVKNCDLGCF